MKYINIIGILLIILISTIGNRIAPGRYCTYFDNDTLRACGPTSGAENDKQGFWVFLSWWESSPNLTAVVNYENNLRQGWLISFQLDSMQTREAEIYYVNDTIDGEVRRYNAKGQQRTKEKYVKGELDYLNSHFYSYYDDMIITYPFLDAGLEPFPGDTIVVFNSWTNKITYIIIAISSILLILNILNIKHHANKRKH